MANLSVLCFSFLLSLVSFGQESNYVPLKSKGLIPKDITQRTFDKVESESENKIKDQDSKRTKKVKSKFILQSNYALDELLTSGVVLFGDSVTNYINEVANDLLKDNLSLRKQLRFYSIKTDISNAFASDQGMIFVTLGLMSQLENEDQLAFVLAHEISHFIKKHSISKAVSADDIFRGKRDYYENSNSNANIKLLSSFSKQYELDADSMAIDFIVNAGYNLGKAKGIFTVLEFSYLPFEENAVDFSFLESEGFKIDSYYYPSGINPIIFKDSVNDDYSSHPNLEKRRAQFDKLSKGLISNKIKSSDLNFNQMKKISRYEVVRINLDEFDYSKALYNSQVLLKDDPNSYYLRKSVVQALYGIAKFNLIHKEKFINKHSKQDEEGEISTIHHFISKLNAKTSASLFIRYAWEFNSKYKDSLVFELLKDVIQEVKFDYQIHFTNYLISSVETADTSSLERTKIQKIKHAQQSDSLKSPNYRNFLTGIENKEQLKEFFKNVKENLPKKEIKEESLGKYEIEISEQIESVLFVDPKYYFIDKRKGLKFISSEKHKYIFYKQLKDNSSRTGLKSEVLAFKEMRITDVELYNKLNNFNNWIKDNFICSSIKQDWKFITPRSEDFLKHMKAYNTNYLAYTGVFAYNENRRFFNEPLSFGLLVPYTLPIVIGVALTPKHYTYYYTTIYNVKTGSVILDKVYDVDIKANSATINSFMYDLMKQIVKKK